MRFQGPHNEIPNSKGVPRPFMAFQGHPEPLKAVEGRAKAFSLSVQRDERPLNNCLRPFKGVKKASQGLERHSNAFRGLGQPSECCAFHPFKGFQSLGRP